MTAKEILKHNIHAWLDAAVNDETNNIVNQDNLTGHKHLIDTTIDFIPDVVAEDLLDDTREFALHRGEGEGEIPLTEAEWGRSCYARVVSDEVVEDDEDDLDLGDIDVEMAAKIKAVNLMMTYLFRKISKGIIGVDHDDRSQSEFSDYASTISEGSTSLSESEDLEEDFPVEGLGHENLDQQFLNNFRAFSMHDDAGIVCSKIIELVGFMGNNGEVLQGFFDLLLYADRILINSRMTEMAFDDADVKDILCSPIQRQNIDAGYLGAVSERIQYFQY